MGALIRIILTLCAFFATTFLLVRLTGLFSIEKVSIWLEKAQNIDLVFLFMVVVILLFSDLFFAVTTLSITFLSGYFLGFIYGGIAATIGMLLAGITGYIISRKFGETILKKIVKSKNKWKEAIANFNKYGMAMILLSRVSPILPEVSACMAGMTGMRFKRFFLAWCLNTIPYAIIAAYSGSISSISNPKPAIYTAIVIYILLWMGWLAFRNHKNSLYTQNQNK